MSGDLPGIGHGALASERAAPSLSADTRSTLEAAQVCALLHRRSVFRTARPESRSDEQQAPPRARSAGTAGRQWRIKETKNRRARSPRPMPRIDGTAAGGADRRAASRARRRSGAASCRRRSRILAAVWPAAAPPRRRAARPPPSIPPPRRPPRRRAARRRAARRRAAPPSGSARRARRDPRGRAQPLALHPSRMARSVLLGDGCRAREFRDLHRRHAPRRRAREPRAHVRAASASRARARSPTRPTRCSAPGPRGERGCHPSARRHGRDSALDHFWLSAAACIEATTRACAARSLTVGRHARRDCDAEALGIARADADGFPSTRDRGDASCIPARSERVDLVVIRMNARSGLRSSRRASARSRRRRREPRRVRPARRARAARRDALRALALDGDWAKARARRDRARRWPTRAPTPTRPAR